MNGTPPEANTEYSRGPGAFRAALGRHARARLAPRPARLPGSARAVYGGMLAGGFARLVIRLPNVSLVNLVLGRRAVPELIQGEANPERIASEAARLLTDAGERNRMREALAEVRGRLGEGGASRRAAGEVAAMLAELAEVTRN